jgi:DNA polymerase III subunit beta
MQTTLKLSQINEVMDIMLRFVSKHATLPILENIYIKGSSEALTFRATDMEKYVEISLPAICDEDAVLTVNAKTFNDILRTIDDEHVTLHINQSKDELLIETPQDHFSIKGIPATEYVAIPNIQTKTSIQIDPKMMAQGINKVEYAVTEKNFSPIMTGILMRTKEYHGNKNLVFVGTDSFRLAEYKVKLDASFEQDVAMVLPKIHVLDLKKVLEYMSEKGVETMTLNCSDAMVQCVATINDIHIQTMSLLIQGNFPEYENENIMPSTFNHNILVNSSQCEKAIRKIGTITRSINNYIAITSHEDSLDMNSGVTDLGEGKTTVAAIIT